MSNARIPLEHPALSVISVGPRRYIKAAVLAAPLDNAALRRLATANQSAELACVVWDEFCDILGMFRRKF